RGKVPKELAPILTRLKIKPQGWMEGVTNFNKHFFRVAGCVDSMHAFAQKLNQSFCRGVRAAEMIFA
ncbi:MAG: hypothetical protein KDD53_02500, partial [Bdellovibrionales bacterium]|nr:hypothetical protein [Bdellovibrionales bacterium]